MGDPVDPARRSGNATKSTRGLRVIGAAPSMMGLGPPMFIDVNPKEAVIDALRERKDDRFELRRLDDRQVGGLGAFEYLAGVDAHLVKRIVDAGSVAHLIAC